MNWAPIAGVVASAILIPLILNWLTRRAGEDIELSRKSKKEFPPSVRRITLVTNVGSVAIPLAAAVGAVLWILYNHAAEHVYAWLMAPGATLVENGASVLVLVSVFFVVLCGLFCVEMALWPRLPQPIREYSYASAEMSYKTASRAMYRLTGYTVAVAVFIAAALLPIYTAITAAGIDAVSRYPFHSVIPLSHVNEVQIACRTTPPDSDGFYYAHVAIVAKTNSGDLSIVDEDLPGGFDPNNIRPMYDLLAEHHITVDKRDSPDCRQGAALNLDHNALLQYDALFGG